MGLQAPESNFRIMRLQPRAFLPSPDPCSRCAANLPGLKAKIIHFFFMGLKAHAPSPWRSETARIRNSLRKIQMRLPCIEYATRKFKEV